MKKYLVVLLAVSALMGCKGRVIWDTKGKMEPEKRHIWKNPKGEKVVR